MKPLDIDPDIRRARTPPPSLYDDAAVWEAQKERVFARSWQVILDEIDGSGRGPGTGAATQTESAPASQIRPFVLLPGCLDEPLVLTRDGSGRRRCLSNVCTHRGNLVAEAACDADGLRCRYHGRRFGLDGRFVSMPEFDDVEGFPSADDDLRATPYETWGPLAFTSIGAGETSGPPVPFEKWIGPVRDRMAWLPVDRMRFDPSSSRDYSLEANWALYCENYLEGFHIPFVHDRLASTIDFPTYAIEMFDRGSVQIAIGSEGEPVFEPPRGHPDHGRRVAAYYVFLFPNTLLNFYPWGLSLNVVQPDGIRHTRVAFRSYVLDDSLRATGPGAPLHEVEMEDERIVEAVQRGMRSRLAPRGRYSPTQEAALHHFHRMMAERLA